MIGFWLAFNLLTLTNVISALLNVLNWTVLLLKVRGTFTVMKIQLWPKKRPWPKTRAAEPFRLFMEET
jgi:hypothetical protein